MPSSPDSDPDNSGTPPETDPDRRDFMMRACSACLGGAIALVPVVAGVTVILDPLRRKAGATEFLLISHVDALPASGIPWKFTVRADWEDAWNRIPNRAIGAVYLRRLGPREVQAFNVVCPHLGCAIEYRDAENDFFCPCHNSTFDLATGNQSPDSPSARGLDSLEVRIEKDGEVWVHFQNFQPGIAAKKAIG